jgi:LysM domain-containing protein
MTAIACPNPAAHREERHLRLVPPPARRRRRPRTAVYWRRRVLVLVMVAALFFATRAALGAFGGGPLTAPEAPASRSGRPAVTYVVRPGDTWWSIARALHPSGDLRATVDRLVAAHGGTPLQPGERVALG